MERVGTVRRHLNPVPAKQHNVEGLFDCQKQVKDMVTAVQIIPGAGEFCYSTKKIFSKNKFRNPHRPFTLMNYESVNVHNKELKSDAILALDQLKEQFPNVKWVGLPVVWFTDSLSCESGIYPAVEYNHQDRKVFFPYDWKVEKYTRKTARILKDLGIEAALRKALGPLTNYLPENESLINLCHKIASVLQGNEKNSKEREQYLNDIQKITEKLYSINPEQGTSMFDLLKRLKEIPKDAPSLHYLCKIADLDPNHVLTKKYNEKKKIYEYELNVYEVSYGGTPSDHSISEFISELKSRGYKVMLYPLLMLNMENKPWRGYIKPLSEVELNNWFCGEKGYKRFIKHYATLGSSLKVDAFVIGSEYRGITEYCPSPGYFPGVKLFTQLAKEVKTIFKSNASDCVITYGADWSEYHHTNGYFHLDELWACEDVDVIGIDAYFPLTENLNQSEITVERVTKGWTSGEGWDYYFNGNDKVKFHDLTWAWKAIEHWWNNYHFSNGVQTSWIPRMKKIWFTEFGFPSVDCAANQPNVFFDPTSVDSHFPKISKGNTDFDSQMICLHGTYDFLNASKHFLDNAFLWCYDARPYPYFPVLDVIWHDNLNYFKGHWINGKYGEMLSKKDIEICIDANDAVAKWLRDIYLEDIRIEMQRTSQRKKRRGFGVLLGAVVSIISSVIVTPFLSQLFSAFLTPAVSTFVAGTIVGTGISIAQGGNVGDALKTSIINFMFQNIASHLPHNEPYLESIAKQSIDQGCISLESVANGVIDHFSKDVPILQNSTIPVLTKSVVRGMIQGKPFKSIVRDSFEDLCFHHAHDLADQIYNSIENSNDSTQSKTIPSDSLKQENSEDSTQKKSQTPPTKKFVPNSNLFQLSKNDAASYAKKVQESLFLTQKNIVKNSRELIGDSSYCPLTCKRDGFAYTEPKCNLFVYNVLQSSGISVPKINDPGMRAILPGGDTKAKRPPTSKQWWDAKPEDIGKEWRVIGEGENGLEKSWPGDVITNGKHIGIISGKRKTISASYEGKVVENDWGWRKEEIQNVKILRYIPPLQEDIDDTNQ